ncbi:MAG: hypothetical protein QOG49_1347 [Frankiaceae bacterium]|jgi:hypothetical protein|nr:hypothetical protein [Frankiaceae bacterium]
MPPYELAQVNIAVLRAPLDSPQLADFVAGLEPVNALAESAPGFVWRLIGDGNDATSVQGFAAEGNELIINMSVWSSVEALSGFTFNGEHLAIMRRRREFFTRMESAYAALWWVPAGVRPTVEHAEERIAHLRAHGPTPTAFTLAKPFPAPGGLPVQRVTETCPAG